MTAQDAKKVARAKAMAASQERLIKVCLDAAEREAIFFPDERLFFLMATAATFEELTIVTRRFLKEQMSPAAYADFAAKSAQHATKMDTLAETVVTTLLKEEA